MKPAIIFLGFFVMISRFDQGQALFCYECRSDYEWTCNDPFQPRPEFLIECESAPKFRGISDDKEFVCVKRVDTTDYDRDVLRRGCALASPDPCANSDSSVKSCAVCSTDRCNQNL